MTEERYYVGTWKADRHTLRVFFVRDRHVQSGLAKVSKDFTSETQAKTLCRRMNADHARYAAAMSSK